MVSRWVKNPIKYAPLCGLPPYGDFKTSPSPLLRSSKSRKYGNYGKVPYIVSSYPQSPYVDLFAGLFTCPQIKLTPHISIDTSTNEHHLKYITSKSLSNN